MGGSAEEPETASGVPHRLQIVAPANWPAPHFGHVIGNPALRAHQPCE
jgi:hypothetical protein